MTIADWVCSFIHILGIYHDDEYEYDEGLSMLMG